MKSRDRKPFPKPTSMSDLDIAMIQGLIDGLHAEYMDLMPEAARIQLQAEAMLDVTTELQARAVGLMVATGMDQQEALYTVDQWKHGEPPY